MTKKKKNEREKKPLLIRRFSFGILIKMYNVSKFQYESHQTETENESKNSVHESVTNFT